MPAKRSVVFLCTENSARSQIAEALMRHLAGDRYEVYSAGTRPSEVASEVIDILKQHDIPTKGLRSKSVDEYAGKQFDYAITLCDKARDECETASLAQQTMHWSFPDPKTRGGIAPFLKTFAEIRNRINMFLMVEE